MSSNIIEVAKNIDNILKAEHETFCPKCNEKQWSSFDKLYAEIYGKCVDCSDIKELDKNSPNIFALIH